MDTAADAPVGNFLFEDQSIWIFLLVSVVMGGAAAWTSGKSLAQTWRPAWQIVPAMLVLGLGIRFIHFALFEGTLLSPHYYAIDVVILLVAAVLGYRHKRTLQMTTQYRWLYEKTGPFSWKEKAGGAA
jgi:NO-binding membrane sensor protein with MHYT domain